ncbi:hypothetical protein CGZ95_08935 [Enemella evansiae]|uniref:hypothetical protein n=1 Tax=Enemella evansiae TaxID=2016499 RepID=UPI000B95EF61|nr:hypothetical protein [Enemella evansiae]OYO00737.1 hypothetical protein CGZ95_08935 [Enemella evansiae]
MSSHAITKKPRRPKPVNFGKRRTLRLGEAEDAAVEHMRAALARNRGVRTGDVDYSEALRLLLVENYKSAMVLAGEPEAWPTPTTVELPAELWDGLTECRNRLAHSQGSLYTVMRKLNFDETVRRDEVRAAFVAVQESKEAVARLESRMVAFVTGTSAVADAEAEDLAG